MAVESGDHPMTETKIVASHIPAASARALTLAAARHGLSVSELLRPALVRLAHEYEKQEHQ